VVPTEPVIFLLEAITCDLGESRAASEDEIIHSGANDVRVDLPLLATSINIESFVTATEGRAVP